ncbi:hypothetical protein Goklo_028168, partial [Gossypium klotzschianum]|nr:hypothetical protein [Gossypium klotzschianum]
WNYPASYIGIPTALEDIRLLSDQRSEAQFQWTPYEDSVIRAVIPDEFFQNLNFWHVKVPLVNDATIEMHQTDRVLRQFGFRQLILKALEVLDKEYKIDLRKMNMNWLLACVLDYMPWFRIHSKSYLLSEEQRHRQIRVERERQGLLNLRRRDDGTDPSTAPTQSPGPTPQPTTPTL